MPAVTARTDSSVLSLVLVTLTSVEAGCVVPVAVNCADAYGAACPPRRHTMEEG